jgi:hypothetical protein
MQNPVPLACPAPELSEWYRAKYLELKIMGLIKDINTGQKKKILGMIERMK